MWWRCNGCRAADGTSRDRRAPTLLPALVLQIGKVGINRVNAFDCLRAALPFVIAHKRELVVDIFGHLERAVSHVRGVEEHQRDARVVFLDDRREKVVVPDDNDGDDDVNNIAYAYVGDGESSGSKSSGGGGGGGGSWAAAMADESSEESKHA
jgi:hypothetical protein